MIPRDPAMLLSFVNMKLRDFYGDPDEMCDDLDCDREEILRILSGYGCTYDPKLNRFIQEK